jgi:hypothetical protein
MNELINNLRLDAGISQLKDDPRLVVIDREGNVIDPLIGLEKFAELIVRECISKAEDYGLGSDAVEQLKKDFGVRE